jgi:hypothetical protein
VGAYNAPGLPNIKAAANVLIAYENARMSGAFKETWRNMNGSVGTGTTMGGYTFELDASQSSSEYGTSDTVMPASVDMKMGIYLGRTAQV